jgi:hypothetical protein
MRTITHHMTTTSHNALQLTLLQRAACSQCCLWVSSACCLWPVPAYVVLFHLPLGHPTS